jgi:hypothetical protein
MKRALTVLGMLFGLACISHAGTPMEAYYQGQSPLSGTTILASSAAASGGAFTLTVATPTVVNNGGLAVSGRNCFTKFVIQVSTAATVAFNDNNTTKWTLYGAGLGNSTTPNTLVLTEDHLGPWCTAAGDQFSIVVTQGSGTSTSAAQAVAVEGYTEYGGTANAGPMY